MRVQTFEDLVVWQKAHALTLAIYKATKEFPNEERYGITNQIRRAATSVSANIVEGHSRKSKKEFLQFLNISKGSLDELKYFLILSRDLNYLNKNEFDLLLKLYNEVSKILYAFTQSLLKTKR
jgi:four helix bundle protein